MTTNKHRQVKYNIQKFLALLMIAVGVSGLVYIAVFHP